MQNTGEFMREDKPVSGRKFLGCVTAGLRAIVPTLVKWPIWVWTSGTIVIALVAAGFLTVLPAAPVSAAPEEEVR